MQGLGPLAAGASRIIVGSVFLLGVLAFAGGGLPKTAPQWRAVSVYGLVFMALPMLSMPWFLQYLSTATAAIYYAAIPLFVLLISRLFLKTHISKRRWTGFVIGAVGLMVLASVGNAPEPMDHTRIADIPLLPHVICLLSALGLAAGGVYVQAMPPIQPLSMTASAFLVANLLAIPILLTDMPTAVPPLTGIVGIIGAGCISTGIGALLRGILIRREGAIFTSINGYIIPIYASFLGVIFLSETIAVTNVLAYFLVVTGLLIARK